MLPLMLPFDGGGGGSASETTNNWSLGNALGGASAVIPGFGALLGGYMNAEAARETNDMTERNLARQTELQREFAQHGIQWRVEDARRAGISPLAALGGSGAAYQPMQATYNSPKSAIAEAGINISDAFFKNHLQNQAIMAQADSELDMQLKLAQIGKLKAEAAAISNPLGQPGSDPNHPWMNKEPQPIGEWRRLPNGRVMFTMTPDSASVLQDDILGRLRFGVDRAIGLNKPPTSMLPEGFTRWEKISPEGVWEPAGYKQKSIPIPKQ